MRRTMFTLIAFAALSAWVSAQGPASLPAEIRVKQFQTNRILIENLVDHGMDLAGADSPLRRAEACQRTARTLASYLERAAGAEDADRVAEFANLYGEVVRDGVVPSLDAAGKTIPEGSREWTQLTALRTNVVKDLKDARESIPTSGPVGDNDKVKAALRVIEELKGKVGS